MATLNFGPEWLRNLTGSGSLASGATGSVTASSSSTSTGTDSGGSAGTGSSYSGMRYKLAEHRYGREEMLVLYVEQSDAPAELKELSFIMSKRSQPPLALEPMSKEEQSLLLQCVNSAPMMRSMGRGTNSIHGGRGEGRGRGRGRDEDGPGKMRTRDTWDDRGVRGFERGYSAYGISSEDGSSGLSSRELSRSISTESWREVRQHHEDDELDFRKPDRDRRYDVKDRYGPKNWREPRNDHVDQHDFDDLRRGGRPPTEAVRKIEYERSRSSGSVSFDEDSAQSALPEWSMTNPNEVESVGTFDASGAFLPVKKKLVENTDVETTPPVAKNSDAKPSKSLPCDRPPGESACSSSLSALDMGGLPHSSLKEQTSPSNQRLSSAALGSSSSGGAPPSLGFGIFPQRLPIDSVNNRTVDGAGCEPDDATGLRGQGARGGRVDRTGDILASMAEQDLRNAPADVVDFVSKWTGGESEVKALGDGQQPGDLPKVELEDRWYYKDPQGDVQGPFTNAEMNEWLRTGYFTMNLLVRRNVDGDFCRLGDMIKALGYVPFEPRIGVSPLFNNPLVSVPPVIAGLNQQQQQQQQQQLQKLEQLRKLHQHQLLVAMQQQQQGLLPQEYIRQLQVAHQQQMHQLLHHQQQTQHQLPQLHVQEGFGVMLPPFDPLLGPLPTHPLLHPALLAGGSSAHILPPSQLSAANSTINSAVSAVPVAAANVTAPNDISVSSKCETNKPPTVEQIEKLQFLVLEKEREEKRIELQRLEEFKKLDRQRKADEEQRLMEEKRRVELEKQRLEEDRRQLEELQRQMERDRRMMEEELQAERLENERKLARQKEERERREREKLRLEEELRKEAEVKRRLAELEAARQVAEAEAKQKAEARQKAEAAEARGQIEAAARQKAEAEAKQKEEAERKALQLAKPAWSSSKSGKDNASDLMTLSEIQEAEKMELEEHHRYMERQRMAAAPFEQSKQSNSIWTAPRPQPETKSVPSLLQIQLEQERQLREGGGQQEKTHLLSTKVAEATFGGSSAWKAGTQPAVQWNKAGNSSRNTWTPAVEPAGKKKSSVPADSSSQFPALPSAAPTQSGKKSSAAMKAEKATSKTKKEEDVVQKLFQVTKVRDDLTEWCEKVLNGLQTSVDIPTLVDLLKDIESPQEVAEYAQMYLGESKQVRDFTQQFLERRLKAKSSGKQRPSEDSVWGEKPAIASMHPVSSALTGKAHFQQPLTTSSSAAPGSATIGQKKSTEKDAAEKSKGGKKKKKMQKADSSILGFNVCANSDRVNIGEIDNV